MDGLSILMAKKMKMIQKHLFTLMLVIAFCNANAQSKSCLFMGAQLHLGNGKTIENGALGIKNGKITLAADANKIRLSKDAYDTIINVQGKHIYPGFISLISELGLKEIDAVRATRDETEVGLLNPHVRALTAYNTDSRIIPTIRSNGILTVQAKPQGTLLTGSSSIFKLTGWNWEDAVLKIDDGIHLNWPESDGIKAKDDTSKGNVKRKKHLALLEEIFTDAKSYAFKNAKTEKNIKLEAMLGLFDGSKILYIEANKARDISESLVFAHQHGIKKCVITGGAEALMVQDNIKKYSLGVILSRLHKLPENPDDPVDLPFKTPAILTDNGITVALGYTGEMGAMGSRNLGYLAGTAAAYGLNKDDALKLITSNAALLSGIQDEIGSLETNKKATFFITEGDALDMRTSKVLNAWIDGLEVDLDNPQKQLYHKYSKKYGVNE